MQLRRSEGRAHMSEPCELIIDGRPHTAELVELSSRGARVRASLAAPPKLTLVLRGEPVRAETRFASNGEIGLSLDPRGKKQQDLIQQTLTERLLHESAGRRAHARLTTRWRVALASHAYKQAWVTDMSIGGV